MRRHVAIWIGAALLSGALAGCGGSSSGDPSGTTPAAGSATSASVAPSTDASSASSSGGASTALFTDAEACTWLKKNLPTFATIKDEVGVQAQITIGLASFFDQHGGLENADGYAFDDATTRGCVAEHDQAIKLAGIKSFGNL